MTYFEKNEQKHFFPMFSMLNAIGGISNVADFTTPCVNITNSAFSQLYNNQMRSNMRGTWLMLSINYQIQGNLITQAIQSRTQGKLQPQ